MTLSEKFSVSFVGDEIFEKCQNHNAKIRVVINFNQWFDFKTNKLRTVQSRRCSSVGRESLGILKRGITKNLSKTFFLTVSKYQKNWEEALLIFLKVCVVPESFWRCPFVRRKNFGNKRRGYYKNFVSQ